MLLPQCPTTNEVAGLQPLDLALYVAYCIVMRWFTSPYVIFDVEIRCAVLMAFDIGHTQSLRLRLIVTY